MKKVVYKLLFTVALLFSVTGQARAVQFDLLVLPTEIFNVCDNYFCFPEPSEIAANYVIQNINSYKYMSAISLAEVREKLENNPQLKVNTQNMLKSFEETEKIDFKTLDEISQAFGVKSVIIISCYAITDRSATRRSLWEVLEISSAFKITYPFNLTTTAVLTDNVNNIVMWSSKYNKTVSDSNGYFLALNQAQAASHLEKIKQYFRNNVSQNISQNVHLRFFPKDVRTFSVKQQNSENEASEQSEDKQFMPNALDKLSPPKSLKDFDNDINNNSSPSTDDFIFEF